MERKRNSQKRRGIEEDEERWNCQEWDEKAEKWKGKRIVRKGKGDNR